MKHIFSLRSIIQTIVFLLIFCVALQWGYAEDTSSVLQGSIEVDDHTREFYLFIPSHYKKDQAAPLIVALHGGGGTAVKFDEGTTQGTLNVAADEAGFLIVYPQGIGKSWNDGREDNVIEARKEKIDDVAFIRALLDHLERIFNIDPNRIFATGISNGGMMSLRLGVDLSDRFAAIAPVTACLPVFLKDHMPDHPVSVLLINGTKDPLVPYEGGEIVVFRKKRGKVISTTETINFWLKTNSCSDESTPEMLPDEDPDDDTRVKVTKYTDGDNGSEVILYSIVGGGHSWPGGKAYLGKRFIGNTCRDINASQIIIDFFESHPKPEK